MVYVLNVLSEVAPEWVRTQMPAEWVERYGERLEHTLPTRQVLEISLHPATALLEWLSAAKHCLC
jgi:hypothetical protein